ncbi:oligogalacturonate lyase family protein [Sphingomonas cannabina]|uniref:oligogalacturonate lyase family protein n=1 Tax=Sphingomonas cannabina TaxID=2899123 RepID=UPI001F3F29B3|nr:oligogalacturonate lyase family protein [Sphingomonas cannabina]UIJ47411.1 oligogalacturonate lyase family protein [Sphingomonas cannabina]
MIRRYAGSRVAGLLAALILVTSGGAAPAQDPPREWIDPDTGHRVIRISDQPGSSSLYFNYNGYTPQGDKLLISTPTGIAAYDLKARKLSTVVTIKGPFRLLFTGHRTRSVYYQVVPDGSRPGPKTIYAADVDTGKVRKIAEVPNGEIQTINADETLLGGVETDPNSSAEALKYFRQRDARYDQADYRASWPDGRPMTYAESKEVRMNERLESKIPMTMFVIDTRTGKQRTVYGSTDWLNHLQFSPTDPGLLMYCHEGPWHKVDRLWLIRVDQPDAKPLKLHERTMNMEIAGHEWFSHDGKTVWYDLQTPRGEDFWVAGFEIATGKRNWYHLQRNEWSVHFNSSPDGTMFAGDGGDSEMVAHAPDGKWLYLFKPNGIPDVAGIRAPNSGSLIHPGYFTSERLVNMKNHDYRLEPNVNFTPDGKWLVFRSNMFGPTQVYAVELAKAQQ